MLVYVVNLAVVLVASYLAVRARSKVLSTLLLALAYVSMVLVAGLRHRTVGTDTGYYVRNFEFVRTFADALGNGATQGEFGFWMMMWLVHLFSDEYAAFLFAIAAIAVGCYQRSIVTYSNNIVISFFAFLTLGTYTFFFNGARQGIACAIYSLALGSMLQRQFLKYLGWVLLATLFHKSALVMLPVYLIFSRPNTLKNSLITVSVGCALVVFSEVAVGLTSSVEARYSEYLGRTSGGGHYMVGLSVVLFLLFLWFKRSVLRHRLRYDRFLNMLLFGVIVGVVSSIMSLDPSGVLRLTAYTDIAGVLMWPIVFQNLPDQRERRSVGYFFVVYCLVMFVTITERFSSLLPYTFNPSIW